MKNKKYILLSGILIWIIGLVWAGFDISDYDFKPIIDPIDNMMQYTPLFILVFLVCFGAPVIEEIAFRYWTKGTLWAKITSTYGSAILTYFFLGWIAALAVLFALIIVFFIIKNQKVKFIAALVITSSVFGIAHVGNFSDFFIPRVLAITGLGIIFAYLALKWNIIIAIFAHALYNFSVLLVSQVIVFCPDKPVIINSELYTIEITQMPKHFFINNKKIDITPDSISMSGVALNEAVGFLLSADSNTLIRPDIDFRNYNIKVFPINKDSINKNDIINLIIKKYNLKIDTVKTKIKSLVLNYENNIKHPKPYSIIDKYILPYFLERRIEQPIIYFFEQDFVTFADNDFLKIINEQNVDTLNAVMQRNGLTLKDNPCDTVNVVRISEI